MLEESILVANEKEVLYEFVTILLQSEETLSNNSFIIKINCKYKFNLV